MINPSRIFDSWTSAENELARQGVAKHGDNWLKIRTEFLPGRTVRQIKTHYKDVLDPKINRNPWTNEEEDILFEKYRLYPRKWQKLSEFLPGRTPRHIRYKCEHSDEFLKSTEIIKASRKRSYQKLTSQNNQGSEPASKKRRTLSQTPLEIQVQKIISDFLLQFENSTLETNHG